MVSPVVVTVELNVAAPAALPSRVSMVISAVASVPLKIISVLFAAASIVMLPEVVVILTAASPADKSSAADDPPEASAPIHLLSEELYLRNLPSTFAVDLCISSKNSKRTSPLPAPDIFWFEISL